MVSNMNFPAPIAVLGFLAGVAGTFLSALGILVLLFLRKTKPTRFVGGVVAAGALIYFGLLFTFSLGSKDVVLAPGQEKYFCEIDCHLAYSVLASREERQSGARLVHVTLRTRFDETTISPSRPKDAPLTPNPRQVRLIDSEGRAFVPDAVTGVPLSKDLIPAQSYETELIFRVPPDASQLHLSITDPSWEGRFLIGDEQSLGHKKTYLAVPGGQPSNSSAI